jgi:hypothetical protein
MKKYPIGFIKDLMKKTSKRKMNKFSKWNLKIWLFYLRLLKNFYDFQRNKKVESILFSSDRNDIPFEIELPLRETIYSCILFTLTTIPFLLTERGRSFYLKFCLFGPPITLLWMHLLPPSH